MRTLLHPFDRIVPLSTEASPQFLNSRRWARSVLAAVARARPFGSIGSAATARIDVLPFQLEPALAVLRHGHIRLLIADEVGLGKTIQAGLLIAELCARSAVFRGLVLAPAALIDQWTNELRARFDLDAVRANAEWLVKQSKSLPPDVNPWSLPGIYATSIDLVKRPEVLQCLEDVTWDLTVVDEAHGAAPGTARRAAAHAVAVRSRRVVLMTATPPDGDHAQLAALMGVGSLDEPILRFQRSRADIGLPSRRRTVALHVRLSSAERRLHRLLDAYTKDVWTLGTSRQAGQATLLATLLRKRALSSATSLASSVRRRIALLDGAAPQDVGQQLLLPLGEEDAVSDAPPESVLGCQAFIDAAMERSILERIERSATRAAENESKLRALLRLLRRVRQPAIVFTEYRDTLATIEAAVNRAGYGAVVLHGEMTARERSETVAEFNRSQTLLLATDAASEGLNLHHRCHIVIHFELPWTLTRLEQRTGRVDRLGQESTVHEILLIARSTAERLVLLPLLQRVRAASHRGGRGAARLLSVTESLVAAGVIEGLRIELPREPLAPKSATGFHDEAVEEAKRIRFEKRRAARINISSRILVTSGRRAATSRVKLLIEIALHASDTCWHSELVPLEISRRWFDDRQEKPVLRLAASLVDERWTAIVETVKRHTTASIQLAVRQREIVAQALRRREHAMLRVVPFAARQLVQVGLFDRRALKTLEQKQRAMSSLIEDIHLRSKTGGADYLHDAVEIRLLAVQRGDR